MAGTLKKMRITVACAYGDVGYEFTPGAMVRDFLLDSRYAVIVDEVEMPARPAKLVAKAAKKIADGTKHFFSSKGPTP